ncbi:SpoIIE family protein phosphatase [Paenibacillus whitsoniae]|nr:fused response regulator/phosphatase [Paenibacillus whitsoniae]
MNEMNIAIVDDNKTNLLIIEKILHMAGYSNLSMFSSAKELYRFMGMDSVLASESIADLILMDMMMPEIDGIEACRAIRAQERFRDIPIIFVTALGDSNKMAEALDAGATDYVMKPINKTELLARIRSALRLKYEKDWHRERDKRIQYELSLAKQVQQNVLSKPFANDQVQVTVKYVPSSELAGDFYAWYPIGANRFGIILLDMMGHGIASSLVCMYIYSFLKDTLTGISELDGVMQELNRRMMQLHWADNLMNYYFTAIYLVVDTDARTIEYVNAGHPAGLALVDGKVQKLDIGCCALGLFDHIQVTTGSMTYEREARLVLYTDGLAEWMSGDPDEAADRIMQGIQKTEAQDADALFQQLQPDFGDEPVPDDMCLIMVSVS